MGRLLVILIFILGHIPCGWCAAYQIGLNGDRPPITAIAIASINHQGIVFSPAVGQADFKRYHWKEFSVEGLLVLKRVMHDERAFQQRPAADRAQFDEYVDLRLAKLAPPPPVPAPAPVPAPQPKPKPPPVKIAPAPQPVSVVAAPPGNVAVQPKPPDPPVPKKKPEPKPEPEPETVSAFQLIQPPGVAPGTDHRPPASGLSLSAVFSPAGVFLLLVVMGFSVYAGNEIARFRNRPKSLVCAVSALFPVIGPTIFLLLPNPGAKHAEAMAEAHDPLALKPTHPPTTETEAPAPKPIQYEDDPDSPYLNLPDDDEETHLETVSAPPAAPSVQVLELYRAPEYQFDFSFFDQYFQRFVTNPPSDGQTLVLRTRDLEYPVHHITRLDASALNVIYPSGDDWLEEAIAYEQLEEVEVRGPVS
jgi:hypothetical protein